MTQERTQYRSAIDELIVKSGLKGLAVAREMGITNNRIIALRRAADRNISSDDLKACQAAILRLGGEVAFNQDGDLDDVPPVCACKTLEAINRRVEKQEKLLESIAKKIEALSK